MATLKRVFRQLVLGNVIRTLAVLLGLMQVLIGHWFTVVLAGRPGPGPWLGSVLAAILIAANLAIVPVMRRARRNPGLGGVLARVYMTIGVATILLGLAVGLAWIGAVPGSLLLASVGLSPDTAFEVFRIASAGIVGLVAALLLWGLTFGQAHIRHEHVPVALRDMPDPLRGLRVAHLSDLHIGNGMEGARLDALVARTNALGADLIALTGDLFDADPSVVEEGARALGALRAPRGVYAVLGNHDAYVGCDRVADALARHAPHLALLRKDVVRVPEGDPLYVAGVDDPGHITWTARGFDLPDLDELARELPSDGPVLLLVHRPEAFPQAARLGFPLVLSGHTHGGQLAVPMFEHRLNLARIMTRYDRGLFTENGSTLYVSRGAGVAGPRLRVGAYREIATIELV